MANSAIIIDNNPYFLAETYIVGLHWNCLAEAIPMQTHYIWFSGELREDWLLLLEDNFLNKFSDVILKRVGLLVNEIYLRKNNILSRANLRECDQGTHKCSFVIDHWFWLQSITQPFCLSMYCDPLRMAPNIISDFYFHRFLGFPPVAFKWWLWKWFYVLD